MTQPAPCGLYRQSADQTVAANIDVDLSDCRGRQQLLERLSVALSFPDWYGNNFDALIDCLGDPDWRDGAATVIRLRGLAHFSQRAPADHALLLAVLDAACQTRCAGDAPLAIILEDGPETLAAWPTT